eukprot:7108237-Pyramimonas_sp.AAC.1
MLCGVQPAAVTAATQEDKCFSVLVSPAGVPQSLSRRPRPSPGRRLRAGRIERSVLKGTGGLSRSREELCGRCPIKTQ